VKLSILPGLLEGFMVAFAAVWLFSMPWIEALILGFIIAAVSPAVIVPRMLFFQENKIGTNKKIPTLILAGSSVDDIFAITMFTMFLGIYAGSNVSLGLQIAKVPLSILLGAGLGAGLGFLLVYAFRKFHIRDTKKVLIILGIAILLTSLESFLEEAIPLASLIGVMAIGFILLEKRPKVATRLSVKFSKIWIFAEILLFVLVGSQVNIEVALDSGLKGLLIIMLGLVARSIGVQLSLLGTDLNQKERLFCMIAYLPKATVQAAIGAIPLSLGLASGELILAIAVLSILITAPLGALGIEFSSKHLLKQETVDNENKESLITS
jgi:solute carrier family 9B (sodium/hydrogen exchanger), member 1/2